LLHVIHYAKYEGELIQIDGSEHRWFEERGPPCTFLTYVDDATSRLQLLLCVEGEPTFDYMQATKLYLERYGKAVAFYSDKHTVFHNNKRSGFGGTGMTQHGRALHELGVDIMCANTPAAKGRVERAQGTLQDRLVKDMRLEDISSFDKLTHDTRVRLWLISDSAPCSPSLQIKVRLFRKKNAASRRTVLADQRGLQ
jgi:hypothetical protein